MMLILNMIKMTLDYETIEKNPERISKLKHYINKYNWKEIDFSAGPKEQIKFEKNNNTTALNILYIPRNTKIMNVEYRPKHNNQCKKQVILLMINNGKKSHYLAVTNLSALLEGISSNHKEDFYCLNCFNLYTSKKKKKKKIKKIKKKLKKKKIKPKKKKICHKKK